MKVLDLQCAQGHGFEGWFGSEDDFQSQQARALVQCPLCGDASISKKLSAPRLNLSRASAPEPSDRAERSERSEEGDKALDIAGGTGDLALAFAGKVGKRGQVVHTDINHAMLSTGRNRLLDGGVVLPTVVCDAERLPFADGYFDLVSVAFGLRNMTHKDLALAEMCRVLRPGGKLLVLEFSKIAPPLEKAYDWYSFKVLPVLGKLVAGDDASYRYLAESIRMHPGQDELKAMMHTGGFGHVDYHNLTGGIAALHVGIKC